MNAIERDEIRTLPQKYRPLTAWNYFGLSILFSIPVVGWIFLIIFAISGANINRRSYARSFFCVYVLALIIWGIMIAILAANGLLGTIFGN